MSTAATRFSANQLAVMPDNGKRHELVNGELRTISPAGGEHGRVAMRMGSLLEQHVRQHQLGDVFAAETGFLLSSDPDTVRAPDAAFVSTESMRRLDDLLGYLRVVPDLVVEVVSPHDTSTEVESKAAMWLDFGTRLVLVVDPRSQTIRAYRDRSRIDVLSAGEILDAGDVVPSWRLPLNDVF